MCGVDIMLPHVTLNL